MESDSWIRHAAVPSEQREPAGDDGVIQQSFANEFWSLWRQEAAWRTSPGTLGSATRRSTTGATKTGIDHGLEAGMTSAERAELLSARRRIHELETELAIHRRAAELLKDTTSPKGGSRQSR